MLLFKFYVEIWRFVLETICNKKLLDKYLEKHKNDDINSAAISFFASIDQINTVSSETAQSILKELREQRSSLKLIASENYSSLAVQAATSNILTDKYAEGYPFHRFYAGCDNVDAIESNACSIARELFGAEYAYVQPHSGADANMLAFIAILSEKIQQPIMDSAGEKNITNLSDEDWYKIRTKFVNQKLLAMDYYSGGHLTHGYRHNFSGKLFDAYSYKVNQKTGLVDLDELRKQLHDVKPLILLAGYSAYPRKLNFAKMRELADEVGAVFMVDMSHFAGLVAGKVFSGDYDPVPFAHVVTTTTHKTLRGPRGGMILSKKEYADWFDKGCPLMLGGPIPNIIAAKAVAFKEALTPEFKEYAIKVVENSKEFAKACINESLTVLTGGSDNHITLINVADIGLTGRQAESALRECNITLNRNSLPYDPNGAWYTSGLRLGTPAITTLGMGKEEMKEIAGIIKFVLSNTSPAIIGTGAKKGQTSLAKYNISESTVSTAKSRIKDLLSDYPLYPEIDYDLI
jgi:glycine hydroxymethyltransferase